MFARLLFAAVLGLGALAAHGGEGRGVGPVVKIENPGQCIAPAGEMRRNHMEMLKHQRNLTLREGVRGARASLNGCVACHASKTTGTVLGKDGFCESCHSYASVSLDCWDCHQPRAGFKTTGAKP